MGTVSTPISFRCRTVPSVGTTPAGMIPTFTLTWASTVRLMPTWTAQCLGVSVSPSSRFMTSSILALAVVK